METQLLKDNDTFPTNEILQNALGKSSYAAFEELMKNITDATLGLTPEWKYYNDGKAWLCKVMYKKKTVFWLSAWDKFFKTSFFFTEKNCSGIFELNIEENIKQDFSQSKPVGRLIPLLINVRKKEQIKDVLKVVAYKMTVR